MVHYQGQITGDGELVVKVDGRVLSLHEFLQSTRLATGKRRTSHSGETRRVRVRDRSWAVAK